MVGTIPMPRQVGPKTGGFDPIGENIYFENLIKFYSTTFLLVMTKTRGTTSSLQVDSSIANGKVNGSAFGVRF